MPDSILYTDYMKYGLFFNIQVLYIT